MHYLIDGHNLIAQLPDISLEDPYDEAKLVLQLRSWGAAKRNRRITVVFDGGLPGGEWRLLSTGRIKAVFASENNSADALLRKRIFQATDVGGHTLVSSDREVLSAARSRRMPYVTAELFAQRLVEFGQRHKSTKSEPVVDAEVEPNLTHEEVAEWLQLFESAKPVDSARDSVPPEKQTQKKKRRATASRKTAQASKKQSTKPVEEPGKIKSGTSQLGEDDVAEWLEIFGQGDD